MRPSQEAKEKGQDYERIKARATTGIEAERLDWKKKKKADKADKGFSGKGFPLACLLSWWSASPPIFGWCPRVLVSPRVCRSSDWQGRVVYQLPASCDFAARLLFCCFCGIFLIESILHCQLRTPHVTFFLRACEGAPSLTCPCTVALLQTTLLHSIGSTCGYPKNSSQTWQRTKSGFRFGLPRHPPLSYYLWAATMRSLCDDVQRC